MGENCEKGSPCSVITLDKPEEVARLVGLLEGIADELGWQHGAQMRAQSVDAIHFAAYASGTLAGGLQLVPAAHCSQLSCELVWPEVVVTERARAAHIVVMAVAKPYRGSAALLWPLSVAMWRYCASFGITDIYLECTPRTLHLYQRLGWPLEIVGELRRHWGEDCCLCRMGAAEVAGMMVTRATRSSAYREIVALMTQPLK